MKKLAKFWALGHIKPAIILPLIVIICLGAFAAFWYFGPETKAAGQSVVDASGRRVVQPRLRSFLFQYPIRPVARADADPDDALFLASVLEDARKAFFEDGRTVPDKPSLRRGITQATLEELEDFVAARPLSTWTPSVRNQLGVYYMSRGATTRALEHFRAVWEMTAAIDEPTARQEADFALAHYARQLVALGQTDLLDEVYATHRQRQISVGLQDHWMRTMEKHFRMIKYPHEGYKCGIYALDQIG